RDAYGAREPLVPEPLERAPGVDVEVAGRQGPVDQQEVDMLESEAVEGAAQAVDGLVAALVLAVELGRDEDLVARQPARGQGATDAALVAVAHGGVDVPVAELQGQRDHALGLGVV